MRAPLLLLAASLAWAADERVLFTKSFPGSSPAYMAISVDRAGAATYTEAPGEDPDKFQVEPEAAAAIFDLAEKLGHFKTPLESGLKVANMGAKTVRWENGAETGEARYNYSTDPNAQALQDWFQRIADSVRMHALLRRTIRYDKLGVHDALLRIEIAMNQKRLVGGNQRLPLCDRVAENEAYLHMARERAARLAEMVRAKEKAQ